MPVFRLLSSVPNSIDELRGEAGNTQSSGTRRKGKSTVITGEWRERIDGKAC